MTPKVKIFKNVFLDLSTGHRYTFHGQIWWKSAVAKLPKGPLDYHPKTHAQRDSSLPPFCPKWADLAQNFVNVVTPWRVHTTYTEFGPDQLRFAGFIPERLIFWPKKSIEYRLSAYTEAMCCTSNVVFCDIWCFSSVT